MAWKYEAYPEYKDSGVEWLGEVPDHWSIKKLKYICKVQTGDKDTVNAVDDGDYPFFVRSQTVERINSVGANCEAVLTAGDGVGVGKVFHYYEGKFDYHQRVYMLNNFSNVLGRFVFYYLSNNFYKVALEGNAKSTVDSLRLPQFLNFEFSLPDLGVQQKITDFLDHETAKIDTLIKKQQQLIKLLKEKRQAVISHAVTKGLNPNAPMRDSGIEWLGEMPEHWEVKHLMHLVETGRRIMYGIVLPGPNVEVGVPIVKGGDVKPGRLSLESLCKTTFEIESGYVRSRLKAGDIVYSIRGTIGDVEIVPKEIEGANLTQDAARIAPAKGVDNLWLKYSLESTQVFSQLEIGSAGAAVKGINICDLKKAYLPVPPENEMLKISSYIVGVLSKLDKLAIDADRQITLLRERRTALISAAVTGKIDVRNWVSPEPSKTNNKEVAA